MENGSTTPQGSDVVAHPWSLEQPSSYYECSSPIFALFPDWGFGSTPSPSAEDGDIANRLLECNTLPYYDTSNLPSDDCLLNLGNVFTQSPSVALAFAYDGSEGIETMEAGLWESPLSNTLPNSLPSNSYSCDDCGKIFGQRGQLRKHKKVHNDNDRIHCCNECGLCFHYRKDLKRHRRTKHQVPEEVFEGFKCTVSGCQLQKAFMRRDKYNEHMQKQHALEFSKMAYKDISTSKSDHSKPNLFLESFQHIRKESALQQGIIKKHKCPFENCDKTNGFASRVDLCRHLRSVHTAVLMADSNGFFRCTQEGCKSSTKIYSRKDNFKRHVIAVHGRVGHIEDLIERSKCLPNHAKFV